jgi:hypothetical protein
MSAKIVGYQVQDYNGNNWDDQPSYLILTQETALSHLEAASKADGCWFMIVILDGDIEDPTFEAGGPQAHYPASEVAALVGAAEPLAELLFDHHPVGEVFKLEVDGGEITNLKMALAPFQRKSDKADRTVKITKPGITFGKVGQAKWCESTSKWEVLFTSPWGGWYTDDEIESA